jgi:solute carrier family 45 protein 1/2/4
VGEEIAGGSPDASDPAHQLYIQGVHVAASALSVNAILSWASSLILPRVLSRFGPATVWTWSCVLTASLLALSYTVQTLDGASIWLVSFAMTYTITNTVPYMLVDKFASSDDQGTGMGLVNVAVCIPQLLISLVGGPLATTFGSDRAVFMFGAITNVVAAVVCHRGLVATGASE